MNRRLEVEPPEPKPLTERQTMILSEITAYHGFMREGCPARYISKRLNLHHETVREHFAALFRKGWLKTEHSPATPREEFLGRR